MKEEKSKYYIDYERRITGILKKKKINTDWENQGFYLILQKYGNSFFKKKKGKLEMISLNYGWNG